LGLLFFIFGLYRSSHARTFFRIMLAGEKRGTSSVPERSLYEMSGWQRRRPEAVLPILRHPVGRVIAHHGHHVRVRRIRSYAVLQ